MNKNYLQKATLVLFILSASFLNAQDLGLATGANKVLADIAKAFPIIVAIAFILVGWKALSEYNETKDVMGALKIVLYFLLTVFVIVGAYQVVKNISL